MLNQENLASNGLSRIDEREDELEAEKDNKIMNNKRSSKLSSNECSPVIKGNNIQGFFEFPPIEKIEKKDMRNDYVVLPTRLEPEIDLNDENPEESQKHMDKSKKNISECIGNSMNSSPLKTINQNKKKDKGLLKECDLKYDDSMLISKRGPIVSSSHGSFNRLALFKMGKDQPKYSVKELGEQLRETGYKRSHSSVDWLKSRPAVLDEHTYEPLDDSNETAEVKNLDRWQLENRERKLIKLYGQKDDIYQQARFAQSREKEKNFRQFLDPKVNNKLLDYIMEGGNIDSAPYRNSESKFRNRIKTFFKRSDQNEFDEDSDSCSQIDQYLDKKPLQGLEVAKRELNREIINELIMRKVKQSIPQLENIDADSDYFRVKLKSIVEKVLGHFSSLKGFSSLTVLNSHIDNIIRKLKKKKIIHEDLFDKTNYIFENQDNVVDYKALEEVLMTKYQDAMYFINDLRDKLKIHTQIMLDSKKQIKELILERGDRQSHYQKEESKLNKNKIAKRLFAKRAVVNNSSSLLDDQSLISKISPDKKKNELDIVEKIRKLEADIQQSHEMLTNIEEDLAKYKNKKNVFKIQLRDLYHRILKDDNEILKNDNEVNYVWALKSILNINEDISISLLPIFLDKESAEYMIEYARLQYELEKYCKDNNLTALLSLQKDANFSLNKHHYQNYQSNMTQTFSNISKIHVKEYPEMLNDIKQRLNQLKSQNNIVKNDTFMTALNKTKANELEEQDISVDRSPKLGRRLYPNKVLKQAIKEDNTKIDRVIEIISRLDKMKKAEINRLIKVYLQKKLDDRTKLQFQKSTRFLFGKKEGDEIYAKFMKEQRMIDQKFKIAAKATISPANHTGDKLSSDYNANSNSNSNANSSNKLILNGQNEQRDSPLENSLIKTSGRFIKVLSTTDFHKNSMYFPQIMDGTPQLGYGRSLSLNNSKSNINQSQVIQFDTRLLPKLFSTTFTTVK